MRASLRSTSAYNYLECSPIETLPTIEADGAMKLLEPETAGAISSTATSRLEGTNLSVYLETSIDAPILSITALQEEKRGCPCVRAPLTSLKPHPKISFFSSTSDLIFLEFLELPIGLLPTLNRSNGLHQ